jgi:hypothetical protein
VSEKCPVILTGGSLRIVYQARWCAARDSNPEPAD